MPIDNAHDLIQRMLDDANQSGEIIVCHLKHTESDRPGLLLCATGDTAKLVERWLSEVKPSIHNGSKLILPYDRHPH